MSGIDDDAMVFSNPVDGQDKPVAQPAMAAAS